jgi:hypothetical protein
MTLVLTEIFDALVLLLKHSAGAHCAGAAPGPSALTVRALLVGSERRRLRSRWLNRCLQHLLRLRLRWLDNHLCRRCLNNLCRSWLHDLCWRRQSNISSTAARCLLCSWSYTRNQIWRGSLTLEMPQQSLHILAESFAPARTLRQMRGLL